MKKRNIFLTLGTLLILLTALLLSMGKVTEIEFESPNCGTTTLDILHGKIEGMAYGVPGGGSDNVDNIIAARNEDINYINDNISGKGYNNFEVINMIRFYIESKGGKIIRVTSGKYVFSGYGWIYEKFNRT